MLQVLDWSLTYDDANRHLAARYSRAIQDGNSSAHSAARQAQKAQDIARELDKGTQRSAYSSKKGYLPQAHIQPCTFFVNPWKQNGCFSGRISSVSHAHCLMNIQGGVLAFSLPISPSRIFLVSMDKHPSPLTPYSSFLYPPGIYGRTNVSITSSGSHTCARELGNSHVCS